MEKNLSMSSPGLRERKKQKTRWAIQEHAMRLFAQQGYEETTVEQIAAAAEISPSTFFRYFKTKEDVVVQDRYDDLIVEKISAAPADLGPIATIRWTMREAFSSLDVGEIDAGLARGRLILENQAVRARSLENMLAVTDAMSAALAARLGRPADDFRVRALCGACLGAMVQSIMSWMIEGTEIVDLAKSIDAALEVVENGI
jgi:AcrR family transcriptional regulator